MKKFQVVLLSSGLGLITTIMIVIPVINNYVWNKPHAEFISHRGLSSKYMQNTKAAFDAAGNINAYTGIETDILKNKRRRICLRTWR